MYLDHDTDVVSEAPPILNQWYTVFDDEDVRLLGCFIKQSNDEVAAKDIEVRWTCDGNVYFVSADTANSVEYEVYRTKIPSWAGIDGLNSVPAAVVPFVTRDKRAQSFKVEVRIVSVLGTNQTLECYCVRETLEPT
jgi:hypothetical protein